MANPGQAEGAREATGRVLMERKGCRHSRAGPGSKGLARAAGGCGTAQRSTARTHQVAAPVVLVEQRDAAALGQALQYTGQGRKVQPLCPAPSCTAPVAPAGGLALPFAVAPTKVAR